MVSARCKATRLGTAEDEAILNGLFDRLDQRSSVPVRRPLSKVGRKGIGRAWS